MMPPHLLPADFEEASAGKITTSRSYLGEVSTELQAKDDGAKDDERTIYSSDNLLSVFHKEKQESRCQLPIFLIQIVGKSTALV